MSSKRTIGAMVVGLGGNGAGAVRAALDSPHVHRVVGVDLIEDRCAQAREKFGIETTLSFDQALGDRDLELIYISTSNASHYPLAKAGLERGKKIFTEKPMGITLEETEDMVRAVRATGGWLGVGFELRHYSKLYAGVKEIIDSGEIGELRHINCQYSISPYGNSTDKERWKHNLKLSGGIFQEKLCHYIDLPRWWDGTRVERFIATRSENVIPYYEVSDNVEVTYQFASGAVSHLTFLMAAAGAGAGDLIDTGDLTKQIGEGYRLYFQVVGTRGAVEANVFHREMRVFRHPGHPEAGDKSRMVRKETWKSEDDHLYFHNTRDEKIDAARRAALGLPPAIDPEDAAETMRICYEFEAAMNRPWAVVERKTG